MENIGLEGALPGMAGLFFGWDFLRIKKTAQKCGMKIIHIHKNSKKFKRIAPLIEINAPKKI